MSTRRVRPSGRFHALAPADGRAVWIAETGRREPRAFHLFSGFVADTGRFYLGSAARELLCLDRRDGQIVWRRPTPDWVCATPWARAGCFVLGDLSGALTAFDEDDAKRWSEQVIDAAVLADLAGDGDRTYAADSALNLHTCRLTDGRPLWRQRLLLTGHRPCLATWRDEENHAKLR